MVMDSKKNFQPFYVVTIVALFGLVFYLLFTRNDTVADIDKKEFIDMSEIAASPETPPRTNSSNEASIVGKTFSRTVGSTRSILNFEANEQGTTALYVDGVNRDRGRLTYQVRGRLVLIQMLDSRGEVSTYINATLTDAGNLEVASDVVGSEKFTYYLDKQIIPTTISEEDLRKETQAKLLEMVRGSYEKYFDPGWITIMLYRDKTGLISYTPSFYMYKLTWDAVNDKVQVKVGEIDSHRSSAPEKASQSDLFKTNDVIEFHLLGNSEGTFDLQFDNNVFVNKNIPK